MPDSNPFHARFLAPLVKTRGFGMTPKWVGKDIVRTAWRHAEGGRNVHSTPRSIEEIRKSEERSSAAKAASRAAFYGTTKVVPFPFDSMVSERNKLERNSLSGKFRPARMA